MLLAYHVIFRTDNMVGLVCGLTDGKIIKEHSPRAIVC